MEVVVGEVVEEEVELFVGAGHEHLWPLLTYLAKQFFFWVLRVANNCCIRAISFLAELSYFAARVDAGLGG